MSLTRRTETRGTYRPDTLMKAFIIELETLANGTVEITEEMFSQRLTTTFELAGKASIGGGTTVFTAFGKIFGVAPKVVMGWSRGQNLTSTPDHRRHALKELCTYLKKRYS